MKSMSVIASFPCPGLAAHQVLAVGSLLGVYVTLDIVNFVSPVAPTRFAKPPRGTLELVKKHHTIIIIVCTHFPLDYVISLMHDFSLSVYTSFPVVLPACGKLQQYGQILLVETAHHLPEPLHTKDTELII